MTATLDVRDLCVLFAGPPQASPIDGSVSVLLVGEDTEAMLTKAPGYRVGLPSLTFTVGAGECLAILGTSGAGKSSLLRTLAGLQPQGGGSIRVNGQDVSALPPEQRGIVYLHQEPVLFPHLSVLENVAFPLTLRGAARRDAHRRAFETLELLGVGGVAGNAASALSGGQRHRVALARALCANPAVLLLDEPLSSLDPAVRRGVRDALLQARSASGAATILVTHDLDDAMAVATHISTLGRFGDLSRPMLPAELLNAPPTLHAAQLLGVHASIEGVVVDAIPQPEFRWIGGRVPAPSGGMGDAVACVRSHDTLVQVGDSLDLPVLTVMARREAAHEALLTLQDASGETVTLRAGSGSGGQIGDRVQVRLRHACLFPKG